ncbi:MAG TPA: hypothetical protein VGH38_18890 [Bryobacteraceae bacterium]
MKDETQAQIPTISPRMWAVLLAGGDGVRMRDLTLRITGDHRPKQFCPIAGHTLR